MKCNNCNNKIIDGKKFCGFCGSESSYTPLSSAVVGSNGDKSDKALGIFKVIFFIVFIILPMSYGTLWGDTTKETRPPCVNTTREVQTIVKMDGEVDSVETEIVDGCETPDGAFYQRP